MFIRQRTHSDVLHEMLHVTGLVTVGGSMLQFTAIKTEEVVVEQTRETQQHSAVERGLFEDTIHVDAGTAILARHPSDGATLLLHHAVNLFANV